MNGLPSPLQGKIKVPSPFRIVYLNHKEIVLAMDSGFSLKLVGGHGFGWSLWPHQLFHITTSIGIKNMGVTMLKGDVASSAGPPSFSMYHAEKREAFWRVTLKSWGRG